MSANLLTEKEFIENVVDFPKPLGKQDNHYSVNNGAILYKYNGIDYKSYVDYCDSLLKAGYKQTKYDNCVYNISAFLKDDNMIYAYFLEKKGLLRIVFEPNAILPDNNQLQVGGCELYQLSLDQREVDCGMSYVLKLCDGSFFIIDGGYCSKGESERLYKFLCDKSNKEITVSGWYFSHAHQDHIGCFTDFVEKYSKCVKIDKLYYNFPNMYIYQSKNWKNDDILSTERFYYTVNKYLADIPNIKLHTGQKFCVGNAKIEVLSTHEDLYPNMLKNFNDTSTVIRVSVNGKSIIFLGDTGDEMSDVLISTYGKNLKSDMVQVAHHGFNGAKRKVYEFIDAVTVLWPTADYRFDENIKRSANKYLLRKSKTVKEHIVSGYGTKSIIFSDSLQSSI